MKCMVDNCERNEYGKLKYCENHYRRMLRNGSLEPKRKSNKNLESWECKTCEILKPKSEYGICGTAKNGSTYRFNECKKCRSNRNRLGPGDRRPRTLAKYGLTIEDYDRMLREQEFICPICKVEQDKVMHVDHDHLTGSVRGLLCESCNKGLGFFKDSVDNLRNAIKYLEKEGLSKG